ncbi:hypothetical protein QUF61_03725 [Candidatus Venteria ishoeyi]|uniref:hypothetical protein n=1 Tax=Candidatus Venteria ishoeyi TaxID=1899563 RepID=UPI0025A5C0CB|nr:hypothetical protein [Candidatus Venteria ishoeyi]MDM8545584.1 hypothetical protein [Candidatus Venteria ishoeyi]
MKLIKWVIAYMLLVLVLSSIFGLFFFRTKHNMVEREIISKVRNESAYLSTMESIYSLVFTNFQSKWWHIFSGDDIYIRTDQASVFYGYSITNTIIKVKKEESENVLLVILPQPEKISTDRRTISTEVANEGYIPEVKEDGKEINIEKYLNTKLDNAIEQYEQKMIKRNKDMSKQYFEALAHRFSMRLELKFMP